MTAWAPSRPSAMSMYTRLLFTRWAPMPIPNRLPFFRLPHHVTFVASEQPQCWIRDLPERCSLWQADRKSQRVATAPLLRNPLRRGKNRRSLSVNVSAGQQPVCGVCCSRSREQPRPYSRPPCSAAKDDYGDFGVSEAELRFDCGTKKSDLSGSPFFLAVVEAARSPCNGLPSVHLFTHFFERSPSHNQGECPEITYQPNQ